MSSTMDFSFNQSTRTGSFSLPADHERIVSTIRRGNVESLKLFIGPISKTTRLLQALSVESNSGQYPLHYTIKDISPESPIEGRGSIVSLILDNLPDGERVEYLNLRNTQGQTALHTAAWADEIDVVHKILVDLSNSERESLIKMTDGKKLTVLQYDLTPACKGVLEELCSYEEPNIKIENDNSFDFVNVYKAHELVAWPADYFDPGELGISSKTSPEDFILSNGMQPEDQTVYVTAENAFQMFEHVIDYVRKLKSIDIVLKLKNPEGMTILHMAAKYGKYDLVDKLLSAVSVTIDREAKWKLIKDKCNSDRTALHYAALKGCLRTTQALLDHGKDYRRLLLPEKDQMGKTALHIAASLSKSDLVHKLLSCVDSFELREHLITEKCNEQKTSLHYAAVMNNDTFEKMLGHMEDKRQVLCHKDNQEVTILHLLSTHQKAELVDSLLGEMSDSEVVWGLLIGRCSLDGRTPLHYAVDSNDLLKVKLLLKHSKGRESELLDLDDRSGSKPTKKASGKVNDFLCIVKNSYWRTMDTPPTALIFYTKLDNHQAPIRRVGAEEEKDQIKSTLQFCGIEPSVFPDFSKNQIIEEIRKAQQQARGTMSAFIVIIMTHAENGWLMDCHLNTISVQSVMDDICDPAGGLDNVPKVLMLQCCRADSANASKSHDACETKKLLSKKKDETQSMYLPPHSCIIYSTLEGKLSIRNKMATAFKTVICKQKRMTADLTDIIVYVNGEMGNSQCLDTRNTFKRHLKLMHESGSLLDRLKRLLQSSAE